MCSAPAANRQDESKLMENLIKSLISIIETPNDSDLKFAKRIKVELPWRKKAAHFISHIAHMDSSRGRRQTRQRNRNNIPSMREWIFCALLLYSKYLQYFGYEIWGQSTSVGMAVWSVSFASYAHATSKHGMNKHIWCENVVHSDSVRAMRASHRIKWIEHLIFASLIRIWSKRMICQDGFELDTRAVDLTVLAKRSSSHLAQMTFNFFHST